MEAGQIIAFVVFGLFLCIILFSFFGSTIEKAITNIRREKDSELKRYESLNNELQEKITEAEAKTKEAEKLSQNAESTKKYYEQKLAELAERTPDVQEQEAIILHQLEAQKNALLKKQREAQKMKDDIERTIASANEEATRIVMGAHAEAEAVKKETELAIKNSEYFTIERIRYGEIWHTLLSKQCNYSDMYKRILEGKLAKAFESDFEILDISKIAINLRSGQRVYENVTLSSCPCEDFKFSHAKPCKHMLFLAYNLGILQLARKEQAATFARINSMVQQANIKKAPTKGAKNQQFQSIQN